MSIRKRGKHWHVDLPASVTGGKRFREALPHAVNKSTAQEIESQMRLDFKDGKRWYDPATGEFRYQSTLGTDDFLTFADTVLIPWCKENHRHPENAGYLLNMIRPFFENKRLRDVDAFFLERFRAEYRKGRNGTPRRNASVNRALALISRVFVLAKALGKVTDNPVRLLKPWKEDNARTRVLSADERAAMGQALQAREDKYRLRRDHLRPMVQLSLLTGMRKGEILTLRRADVNLEQGIIELLNTKNGRRRIIPLSAEAAVILRDALDAHQSEYVFINRYTGKPFRDVKKGWQAVLDAAGIEGFTWHGMRHDAASRAGNAGVDVFTMQQIFGWQRPEMAARYTHPSSDSLRRAVNVLAGHNLVTKAAKAG